METPKGFTTNKPHKPDDCAAFASHVQAAPAAKGIVSKLKAKVTKKPAAAAADPEAAAPAVLQAAEPVEVEATAVTA